MISVTKRARNELKRILTSTADDPNARLRLLARGQGNLGLGLDIELPNDEVVKTDGTGLLVVEKGLSATLEGVILDVDDTDEGTELVICEKRS